MQEKIEQLKKKIAEAIKEVHSSDSLFQIKMKYLGKSGEVSELMKGMRDVPKDKRPEVGMIINALKVWAEDQFGKLDKNIKAKELKKQYAAEAIDVTLPGNTSKRGAYHPNTLVRRELISIFAGMGFTVFEGPEIENEYYNFTALNTPADHPARDMQEDRKSVV